MAWNGSGVFSRLYNWAADAAAGTKILASKQDAEIAGIVVGLNNCLTLDGQNSPSADVDWGANKITNLAAGTAAADAVRFDQLGAVSEWVPETLGTSYISATSFKVLASDQTLRYTPGRRVMSTNTGGVRYSTVVDSSYGAPDTTVTVVAATSLDSGFTDLAYGLGNPSNASKPRYTNFVNTYTTSNLSTTDALLSVSSISRGDSLGEWSADANARFTPRVTGNYFVQAMGSLTQSSSNLDLGAILSVSLYEAGALVQTISSDSWPFASGAGTKSLGTAGGIVYACTAGTYYDVRASFSAIVSGTPRLGATIAWTRVGI